MPEAEPDQLYHLSEAAINRARATDNPEATLKQTYEKTQELFEAIDYVMSDQYQIDHPDKGISETPNIVDRLIKEGADINATNAKKHSILAHAALHHDDRVLSILLEFGAQSMPASQHRIADLEIICELKYSERPSRFAPEGPTGTVIPKPRLQGMFESLLNKGFLRLGQAGDDLDIGDMFSASDLEDRGRNIHVVDVDGVIQFSAVNDELVDLAQIFNKTVDKTQTIGESYGAINTGTVSADADDIVPQDLIDLYVNYSNHDEDILECLSNHIELTLKALEHVPPHIQQEYKQLLGREITALNAQHTITGPATEWSAVAEHGEGVQV